MTDYTTLSNTAVGVGGLPSGATVTALRDNPIAIAEGSVGAPKIENAAHQPPIAGTTYLIKRLIGVVGLQTIGAAYYPAGAYVSDDNKANVSCGALVAGTITARLYHRNATASGLNYVRILKNGVLVIEWSTSSTSLVLRQVDIVVAFGDAITFQMRSSSTGLQIWQDVSVYSNNPNFAVA